MDDGAVFWMNGRLATGLTEISHDPSALADGGFWAVSTTFEGEFTAARFTTVVERDFPKASWGKLTNTWISSRSKSQYIDYVKSIQRSIAEATDGERTTGFEPAT